MTWKIARGANGWITPIPYDPAHVGAPVGLNSAGVLGGSLVALLSVGILMFAHHAATVNVAIPPESQLLTATGVLEPAVSAGGGKSSVNIGLLSTTDGQFVPFSCRPFSSDLGCIYSVPYVRSPLIGKQVTILYFSSPSWLYPAFQVGDGLSVYGVPRQYSNIVMSASVADDAGSRPLFTYAQAIGHLRS